MARATSKILLAVAALAAAPAAEAQLGIDLTAPDKKPAPPAAQKRDESLSLPALELGKTAPAAEAKARLDAAKRLLDEKATETAALAFDQILREPALAVAHDEARYQLGKALARMGLLHSALATFDEVLAKGPGGSRFYGSSMEWLFYAGNKLKNEQPLLSRVAKHARDSFPPGFEDRFHFLLAKYEFERGRALADAGRADEARGAWGEARRLVSLVREQAGAAAPKGDAPSNEQGDVYAKARFVDGLVLYASGDDVGASEAFKQVVRLTNPKRGRASDPQLRELAFLQLARIHYQNRQNRYAIFYYGKMPWGGESWLEGLWEASYAHYRIGDYEKTLGNLLTLQSPYFKDEYFPESYVLKSIVYYENCRYPEARRVLETFAGLYQPVYDELVKTTAAQRPPAAYYDLLDTDARGGALPRRIMKLAFTDQNVRQLAQSVAEVEDEMDRGIGGRRSEFRQSALAKRLGDQLRAEKVTLVEEAGARTRAKLEWERDQLRSLLAQALRIKIEVSRKEREALEGSLARGSQVEVVKDLKYSSAVSDEHLYWPYEGEFWRDELGTYSYTLTRGCKDRLSRPGTASK
ncbi:adventurous gliding motility protein GltC [Anaeromyxobacter sp. PSR-1]|uniref:adventurous gliding motility protein GltC n=1 Tax=Anaeromyxobacter sp. PSR-1 TaxID=1300915 RepID=UPI0005E08717|nr:adventurous gliding motility protein GltC [Anaeromyxobacter sp. PSR-1]GAO04943.1 tetratricopeptide repeat protein [Anaeromyxobacter sp. PSR-1]